MYDLIQVSVSLLIGAFLGNWLAIGRDKRRHFLGAVDPARNRIINALNSGRYWHALDGAVLDQTRHVLSSSERQILNSLENEFSEARRKAARYDRGEAIPPTEEMNAEAKQKLESIVTVLSPSWWRFL